MLCLTEQGALDLLLNSRKPEAREFREQLSAISTLPVRATRRPILRE